MSFPRCKAEAALLLSLFPFFLFFFFIFLLQHKTTYCDGPLKRKKIALQALFWGKARPRKKKRNIFYGWDKLEVCIFYLFHISDTTPSTPKTLWMRNQPRASTNSSWQNGIGNAVFLERHETFLRFVKYSKEKEIGKMIQAWYFGYNLFYFVGQKSWSFYFLSDIDLVYAEKKIQQNRVPAWKNF